MTAVTADSEKSSVSFSRAVVSGGSVQLHSEIKVEREMKMEDKNNNRAIIK